MCQLGRHVCVVEGLVVVYRMVPGTWQACSHGVLIKADLSYIDVSQNTPYLYLLQHPAGCAAYLEGGSINCVPRYHTQPLYTKRHDIKIFFFYLSFQFKQQFFYFNTSSISKNLQCKQHISYQELLGSLLQLPDQNFCKEKPTLNHQMLP